MKPFPVLLLFFVTVVITASGQDKGKAKKNYCVNKQCTLAPDDPAHFDPYYNGHLCENFNPDQAGFSKEYFALQTKEKAKASNQLHRMMKYDFSSIWAAGDVQQNGVLDRNYQRIQMHFSSVTRGSDKATYLLSGLSKVNNNICKFKGEMKLMAVYGNDCEDSAYKYCGTVFASYVFYEDSSQAHAGVFSGVSESLFYLGKTGKRLRVDESMGAGDGYWNRTFVGTWTEYRTGIVKKCIWGDHRLPFTFDFDCSDGEMMACDKYSKNGWQSFNDLSEFVVIDNGKVELKNKWWLAVK